MDERKQPGPGAPPLPAWRTCLDVEEQAAGHYLDFVNTTVFDALDGAPRRALDLGCAGGALGAALKQRFPDATVVGVEASRAAAQAAAAKLDRVICARLESVDFAAEGLRPGEFDTVIAADVLEHMVNPWALLERLKPLLAPRAQVIASIPNVRNLGLVSQLLQEGRWEYRERGLLDVTHLRFFTLAEIRRMFEDSGYVLEGYTANLTPSMAPLYRSFGGRDPGTIQAGRLTLTGVTAQELTELCAEQFIVRCRSA
jgi:2-polyprenyl-3-methyl-5-hydroxy-6-metoxy-1,4-benzoquinol methylase